ncbi:MAG: TetR/AcrR family transcriptional regulator [Bacteroidota bacterium]
METPWIDTGYTTLALEGPKQLRVERLAKKVGKSKSSFYHHFADMEVFISFLLANHLDRIKMIADKEAACDTIDELFDVIIEHKVDLLFNRQLRFHRDDKDFVKCYEKANELALDSILDVWAKFLDLTDQTYLARMVLVLVLENFFLQISAKDLNKEWLQSYFNQIRSMIAAFKNDPALLKLDGTV